MADQPSPPTGDLTGQTFGQYEIGEQVGQGGMATVYRARQTSIGRTVAVKIMPTYFLGDHSFLQRFEREVKVIADLQHPRILPVYDYGQIENRPYIVMAYMPGGTLADRIRKGAMPLPEITRLVDQIAEGLDHAHRKGIIHRDFKPSNVLLDENGNAYLADFGIAKVTESTMQLTGSGMVGTPAYMAPEMAEHGELSTSVDIYALGITLYQMLTGKYPYQGETPIRVMMAHTQDPIPDVRETHPELPEAISAVVKTAMAKKPADRFATAGDLAAALRDAASGKPVSAPAPTHVPPPPRPPAEEGVTSAVPPLAIPVPVGARTPPPPSTAPGVATGSVAQPARKGFPVWLIILGALALFSIGICVCLLVLNSGGTSEASLTVDNQSGTTVCQVYVAEAGSGTQGEEKLNGHQVDTGSTYTVATGLKPGQYDLSAYACDSSLLADDRGVQLNAGDFRWIINAP